MSASAYVIFWITLNTKTAYILKTVLKSLLCVFWHSTVGLKLILILSGTVCNWVECQSVGGIWCLHLQNRALNPLGKTVYRIQIDRIDWEKRSTGFRSTESIGKNGLQDSDRQNRLGKTVYRIQIHRIDWGKLSTGFRSTESIGENCLQDSDRQNRLGNTVYRILIDSNRARRW
jgi:hypothetical protein